MTEKKNGYSHPHGGHRNRLKERFRRVGLAGFEEHEILELLLFYSIPQRDTNELAHQLISEFGGLKQVLGADYEHLLESNGISEHSATLIRLVWQLCDWRDKQLLSRDLNCLDEQAIAAYLQTYFRPKQTECVIAILTDAQGRKIGAPIELATGNLQSVQVPVNRIVEEMTKRRAESFVLAHNHPDGTLRASVPDQDITVRLYRTFSDLGKPMREHYLITNDGYLKLVKYCQDQCFVV